MYELSNIISGHDIVSFSETWCQENDLPFVLSELTDYTCELLNAVKLHKYGRAMGGIAVYIKKHIAKYIKRINVDFSHGIALKICKTYTNLDFDIILLCVYIPPEGSPRYNNEDLNGIVILKGGGCYLHVVPLVTSFRRLNTPSTCLPWVASRIGGRRDPGG